MEAKQIRNDTQKIKQSLLSFRELIAKLFRGGEKKKFPQPRPDGRYDVLAVRDWREKTRNSTTAMKFDQLKARHAGFGFK